MDRETDRQTDRETESALVSLLIRAAAEHKGSIHGLDDGESIPRKATWRDGAGGGGVRRALSLGARVPVKLWPCSPIRKPSEAHPCGMFMEVSGHGNDG